MNILQIVRDAYIAIGSPSDLQYYVDDPNVPDQDPVLNLESHRAWCTFVDVINDALVDLATWKFSDGHQLRFRFLEDVASFMTSTEAGVLASIAGNIVTWTGGLSTVQNYYRGWLVTQSANSAASVVLQSYTVGGVNYLFLATPTNFVAGALVLSKREYRFTDIALAAPPTATPEIPWDFTNGRPIEILEVVDANTQTALPPQTRLEPLLAQTPALSVPTSFYKLANGVRFDSWPDTTNPYLVRFIRSPRLVGYLDAPATTEVELPLQFHRAVWLWVLWWGLRREEMSSDCYSVKKDLEDFLKRTRTEDDFQDSFRNGQFKLSAER